MEIVIAESALRNLETYASIPISFVIKSRLDLDKLWLGEYVEIPVEPRTKDYDAFEPTPTLTERFDVTNWGMLSVQTVAIGTDAPPQAETHGIGGAIVAIRTPDLDMLEGRNDLAILWDIRVHPIFRRKGVGRALFEDAKKWAKKKGCIELRVETQDTNVDACRFYRRMGCRLHSIHENAYAGLDEARIIWTNKI
jgi:ribosomal protein S18 acetylase RimI-like enzyme